MNDRVALYRCFAADGALLYVGISVGFARRWYEHAKAKSWWPEVARLTVDLFPDRPSADAAETAAIRDEKPRYNVGKTPTFAAGCGRSPRVVPESLPQSIGMPQIALMLGICLGRVRTISREPGFPAVALTVGPAYRWRRDDVIGWAKSVGRLPPD